VDDTETQTTVAEPANDAVPEAVTAAFSRVFDADQQDELVQEGLVTEDGNAPADQAAIDAANQTKDADPSDATDGTTTEAGENAEPSEEKQGQPDKLDPFLRFVGQQAAGLTDAQIDKLYAADPETAIATLNSLAGPFVDLSRQYAGQPASPVAPGTQQAVETPAQTPTPGYDAFMAKLADFTEANGEDMGTFAKLVNDELVAPLKALMAANVARENDLVRQEATTGFEAVRKDFGDFYGPENGTLSEGQRAARSQVASIADQIRAGAKAAGKSVSVKDAIARAHAIVTHDMRQTAARKEIVGQVQRRAKAVTAKPTQRQARPSGERSDKAGEDAARAKMLELGFGEF
jgi:hypothetical protein